MIGRNAIGRSKKTVGMFYFTPYTMRNLKAKDDPTLVFGDHRLLQVRHNFFFGAYIDNGLFLASHRR